MAATLTLVSATPNSLKYEYEYDGAGSLVGTLTRAQAILDAATAGPGPSPLLALFNATIVGQDWAALPEGPSLTLSLTPTVQTVGASTIAADFDVGLTVLVTGVAQANGDKALIEIAFNNTLSD